MALDEVLGLLRQQPQVPLYLDLKIQPPLTLTADKYAQAVIGLWREFALQNRLIIEVPDKESTRAFLKHHHQAITLLVSYPAFYAKENWTWVGIKAVIKGWLNPSGAKRYAIIAKADGIATPLVAFNSRMRKHLHQQGLHVAVFTANTTKDIQKAHDLGADLIISDYPDKFN